MWCKYIGTHNPAHLPFVVVSLRCLFTVGHTHHSLKGRSNSSEVSLIQPLVVDIQAVTHRLCGEAGVQVLADRLHRPIVPDFIELQFSFDAISSLASEPLSLVLVQSHCFLRDVI